jgi:hypothetical protein
MIGGFATTFLLSSAYWQNDVNSLARQGKQARIKNLKPEARNPKQIEIIPSS